jgi:proteic killer suppression protein
VSARKLDQLNSVVKLEELKVPLDNRLESLSGSRMEEYSIRINEQYSVCFKWSESGPFDVEIDVIYIEHKNQKKQMLILFKIFGN